MDSEYWAYCSDRLKTRKENGHLLWTGGVTVDGKPFHFSQYLMLEFYNIFVWR